MAKPKSKSKAAPVAPLFAPSNTVAANANTKHAIKIVISDPQPANIDPRAVAIDNDFRALDRSWKEDKQILAALVAAEQQAGKQGIFLKHGQHNGDAEPFGWFVSESEGGEFSVRKLRAKNKRDGAAPTASVGRPRKANAAPAAPAPASVGPRSTLDEIAEIDAEMDELRARKASLVATLDEELEQFRARVAAIKAGAKRGLVDNHAS